MTYLIFDQEEELLDVLNFDSENELILYKSENPTHIVRKEDDLIESDDIFIDDDDFFVEDEDINEW